MSQRTVLAGVTLLDGTGGAARTNTTVVIDGAVGGLSVGYRTAVATGGMASPYDQPEDEGLLEEEIRAVVDECRRHGGKPVAAHAQGTAGILTAIRGGVTSIEHGYGLNDQALELAGERGTFVVPTLSTVYAGTRVSAELLGVADQLGTVTAGKTADFVLCDGDPLTDIGLLGDPRNILCVVQESVVRKDLLPATRDRLGG